MPEGGHACFVPHKVYCVTQLVPHAQQTDGRLKERSVCLMFGVLVQPGARLTHVVQGPAPAVLFKVSNLTCCAHGLCFFLEQMSCFVGGWSPSNMRAELWAEASALPHSSANLSNLNLSRSGPGFAIAVYFFEFKSALFLHRCCCFP